MNATSAAGGSSTSVWQPQADAPYPEPLPDPESGTVTRSPWRPRLFSPCGVIINGIRGFCYADEAPMRRTAMAFRQTTHIGCGAHTRPSPKTAAAESIVLSWLIAGRIVVVRTGAKSVNSPGEVELDRPRFVGMTDRLAGPD
jgi:hypothetical protein